MCTANANCILYENILKTCRTVLFLVLLYNFYLQNEYSPRGIDKFGYSDGEGTERLWSFIATISNAAKNSKKEHFIDLITDKCLHYSEKLQNKIGNYVNAAFVSVKLSCKLFSKHVQHTQTYIIYNLHNSIHY